MALSVRKRFEVFKRDDFTCRYCGRRSPDVILEVDHIVPVADGGGDDEVNLLTSCWDCNRGKAAVPLSQVITGEDPHDKAIEILEKRRQIEEYNAVLHAEDQTREDETWDLVAFWNDEIGIRPDDQGNHTIKKRDYHRLRTTLVWCPKEKIKEFMWLAIARHMTKDLRYVGACCRNWREDRLAAKQ